MGANEAAQRHRAAACVEFERLGSSLWARAAGSRSSGDASPFDALTPAERRVARLVASGSSNREVADTLCLSTRTVESHLASVYRKLGLQRRGQLAALATGAPPQR
jgi:DNA-binding CsgD family transcriptional regulator